MIPDDIIQLPEFTRAEVVNICRCVDAMRKQVSHDDAKVLIAIVDKLLAAMPQQKQEAA